MAGWQSGHAADCNSVYAGSIPTPASIFLLLPSQLVAAIRSGIQSDRSYLVVISRLFSFAASFFLAFLSSGVENLSTYLSQNLNGLLGA